MTETELLQLIAQMEDEDERVARAVERDHPAWDVIWKRHGFFRLEESRRGLNAVYK